MSDPNPTAPLYSTVPVTAEPADADAWAAEQDALPVRPRRRLATPLNAALAAALLVACGFIGGVLVEKGQTSASPAASGFARRAAFGAGRGTGAPAAGATGGAAATAGSVVSVSGHDLLVTDAEGNTVRVRAATGARVSRTNTAAVSQIHPGDTVVVQGAPASDGTVQATSIRATAPNAAGGGFGALFGGGGGGFGGAGAGSTGGSSRTGAGGAAAGGGGPALFGP